MESTEVLLCAVKYSAAFTAFEGFRNLRPQDQKAWGTLSGPLPQQYAVKVLEQFKTNLNSLEM